MDENTKDFVAACEARANMATPEPWLGICIVAHGGGRYIGVRRNKTTISPEITAADVEFIANARTDLPEALGIIRGQAAEIERLRPDAEAWRKGVKVLDELRARVIPCGHTVGDLIGGEGSVTKCGACLADKKAATEGLFYIQDGRSFVGNSVVWWRKGRNGYTANVNEALTVDRDEALSMQQARDTDRPWPVNVVNPSAARQVDVHSLPAYEPLS